MKLRPHQDTAIEMVRESLRKGNKRIMLAAPCSFGKTITAAAILKSALEKGKRGIFICDRIKLVQQTLQAFDHHGLPFGVMQGDHYMSNPLAPIQIASVQTLARRKDIPDFDFGIVDEAHTMYKYLERVFEAYDNVPMIGLSATPYSKGLGKWYDDLIVPITPRELLEQDYLAPVDYYGGRHVALEGIKTKALSTGGSDYDPKALAERTENDRELVGDVLSNWMKYASGRQTVAFCPSIKSSKALVDQFNAAGIRAEHIDGYMDAEMREELFEAHDAGEFLILSCSQLLNTGWDSPTTSACIDLKPTRSPIAYQQRVGRIMRTAPFKYNAVYLDHAGNVARFGFCEDMIPDELHDGEKAFSERKQLKEKKEPKVKDCPQCYQQMVGIRCKCGYEIPIRDQIETDGSELVQLAKDANKTYSPKRKAEFFGELLYYAKTRGYKEGWAKHKYRNKFGVWPSKVEPARVDGISEEVRKYITSQNIKANYERMRNDSASNPKPLRQSA